MNKKAFLDKAVKSMAGSKKSLKPEHCIGSPIWFANNILGLKLYPWQERVLWDVALGKKPVSLRAANGSGKTQCIALPLLLWHAAVFPYSQAVTTAGVYRQVKEQLWGTLNRYKDKLGPGWHFNATELNAPNGSRGIGFSTDDPGKFEGWHNENLLMIFDEAKSIPDEIFEAMERCQPTRVLFMSSAGTTEGEFAASFLSRPEFYSTHTVTSYDCPHLSDEWIQGQIDKRGRNHPLVRSMIFSEFIDVGGSAYVIPPSQYLDCRENPPEFEPGGKIVFIDWAAGGDENVMAIVDGNKVDELICWRDRDTMAAANRAASEIVQRGIPSSHVFADDGGLGHPINDALAQGGFPVKRILNNAKSNEPDIYQNLGSELWFTAARRIEKNEVILPDDDALREQCTSRKVVYTATGKLALEKKQDMRDRGLGSPDRADAVLGAIAIASMVGEQYIDYGQSDDPFDEPSDDHIAHMEETWSGAYAGL